MKRLTYLLAATGVVACSDAFQPTVDNVIGDYTARTFTITDSTGTRDLLKAGAVFTLGLAPRGGAFGYLYIPAIAGDSEVVADFRGTWTMYQGVILIDQPANTVVVDMAYFAGRRQLYGSRGTRKISINALLTR